jgi:hypothetical protein
LADSWKVFVSHAPELRDHPAQGSYVDAVNGGRTWHREASPTRAPLYRIACAPPSSCYAVNNSNPFGDGSSTVSFYSATGQNGRNLTLPSGLVINDIACPAARTCYTVGAGGVILCTTNGTRLTRIKTTARENLNGIACVTVSDCYAVGAAGTIETLRAG